MSSSFPAGPSSNVEIEAIFESIPHGMVLLDTVGRVERCNHVMAELLGLPAEFMIGLELKELVHPSDRALLRGIVDAATASLRDREVRWIACDGSTIGLTVSSAERRDERGKLHGVVLTARDERVLKEMRARLQMADRLATMGTLSACVAHEINNPLAFILANLDFLRHEVEVLQRGDTLTRTAVDEIAQALDETSIGALRVQRIVQQLKTFARTDPKPSRLMRLEEVVGAALPFVRTETRHRAAIEMVHREAPPVFAEEGQLLQIVINLVQNAAHAIPVGGDAHNRIVLVTDTAADGRALLEVMDTGSGIEEERLPRIFEPFYTTKPAGVGTGLGLAIVRRLVEEIGGEIEVESEVGAGTVFRLWLPAAREAITLVPDLSEEARPLRELPRLRLLVIDDEESIRRALERVLRSAHDLTVVASGLDALRAVGESRFDLILCDLLMPQLSGMQLYAALEKERPELCERVIFMTVASDHPEIQEFLGSVRNPCLIKPFERRALDESMAVLLEGLGEHTVRSAPETSFAGASS